MAKFDFTPHAAMAIVANSKKTKNIRFMPGIIVPAQGGCQISVVNYEINLVYLCAYNVLELRCSINLIKGENYVLQQR